MDTSPERESPISGALPPMICANLREKILPEEVQVFHNYKKIFCKHEFY